MLSSDIQGSNPDDLCRDLGIHGEILRKVMAYADRWRRCAYDSRRRGDQRVEDHADSKQLFKIAQLVQCLVQVMEILRTKTH